MSAHARGEKSAPLSRGLLVDLEEKKTPYSGPSHSRRMCVLETRSNLLSFQFYVLTAESYTWYWDDMKRIWNTVSLWEQGTRCTFCAQHVADFTNRVIATSHGLQQVIGGRQSRS